MRHPWSLNLLLILATMLGSSLLAAQTALGPNPRAAQLKNPIPATAESISEGKQVYQRLCRACHHASGNGKGPYGIGKSIRPSDFTDDKWDYGSSDGEIFTVIKNGIDPARVAAAARIQRMGGPSLEHAYDERLSEADIWNVVNYIRTFAKKP